MYFEKGGIATNYIEQYNDEIQSGRIPACKKLIAVYQHVVNNMHNPDLPYEYNDKLARRAVDFIEQFCYIPKHSPRTLMKLELWQRAFISCIFGFVRKDNGARQYQEAVLYVGRKNAKSCLAAAIAVYVLLSDNEPTAEAYCAATTRQQAQILWKYACELVKSSPDLRGYFKKKVNSLEIPSLDASFVPLSKDSGSLDGLSPSLILIDELHAIKDVNMYEVLRGGTYSRRQPLTIICSTGGYIEPNSIFDQKYAEYQQIIDGYKSGEYVDETTLPILYELDDKSEMNDEKAWLKANPNLGVSKSIEILRQEVNRASLSDRAWADLACKQFNVRQSSREAFFQPNDVIQCKCEKLDYASLDGCSYICGIDLGTTTDLTCATAIVKQPGDDVLKVLQMYWIPESTIEEHEEQDKAPYSTWISNGYMRTVEGSIIDTDVVLAWFREIEQKHGLYMYKCGYDQYHATYLAKTLRESYGNDMIEAVGQTFKALSAPMYASRAMFKDKKILFDNPVFTWNLLNTQVQYDQSGNVKPFKNRNLHVRIDGYSSFLSAFAVYQSVKDDLA
ncbi:putative phage terminase large subunit (plasmid) [Selenomonas ruminantium subsp. lactilytica TAM6421]|uniref:Putative phage terminase large subunit n=1 Tax=Selenomonas ruminantium subsp. lactilytica (strain NBRC 103574 / TAM6421) TaxID=927704 RepID=I0GWQ7_SELRL|nr:terminase TerL endonuclease subunit [Selenomonas ruminantium]BAL85194.1 putative phage terminase large subunit [Selenomonas ruminantium subsp. lactilytica TAM6421]